MTEEIVHIIPLGLEIDRAVKPFEGAQGFRANRVYLLSIIEHDDTPDHFVEDHRKYVAIVKEKLQSLGIQVIVVNTKLIDIHQVMTNVSAIIRNEKRKGNIVYVNMSSAGRLTSVAATFSAMFNNVKVYYVEADDYSSSQDARESHGISICCQTRIIFLEQFQLYSPDPVGLDVIAALYKQGTMRTYDILRHLKQRGVGDYQEDYYRLSRAKKVAITMKINRNVLRKMMQGGYLVKKKIGRESEYYLTGSGRYLACISGLVGDIST